MERNFKKEIQEAASNPIDMAEMMAQLVQVRKGYVILGGINCCTYIGMYHVFFTCPFIQPAERHSFGRLDSGSCQ